MKMTGLRTMMLGLLVLFVMNAARAEEAFDWNAAGHIAVQSGGRVKTLDTFSRELVKAIYGKSSYQNQNPVETYFRWMADGEYWANQPLFYLTKGGLRGQLGMDAHSGNHFSMLELEGQQAIVQFAIDGQKREEAGEKATFTQTKAGELLGRMHKLSGVFSHQDPLFVPPPQDAKFGEWKPMTQVLGALEDTAMNAPPLSEAEQYFALSFAGIYNSVRDSRADIFNTAVQVFVQTQEELLAVQPDLLSRLAWENRYNRYEPYRWARVLLALAFVLYLFSLKEAWSRLKTPAWISVLLGFVLYSIGLGMRA